MLNYKLGLFYALVFGLNFIAIGLNFIAKEKNRIDIFIVVVLEPVDFVENFAKLVFTRLY